MPRALDNAIKADVMTKEEVVHLCKCCDGKPARPFVQMAISNLVNHLNYLANLGGYDALIDEYEAHFSEIRLLKDTITNAIKKKVEEEAIHDEKVRREAARQKRRERSDLRYLKKKQSRADYLRRQDKRDYVQRRREEKQLQLETDRWARGEPTAEIVRGIVAPIIPIVKIDGWKLKEVAKMSKAFSSCK